ncbi:MAG: alpha-amylase family protein [Aliiglaciecola sp.]
MIRALTLAFVTTLTIIGCQSATKTQPMQSNSTQVKPVVYQVFTRLFGNTQINNIPWGTIEQNGVGKFSDFTPQALQSIKALGVSHVWYTGVPHHAVINDYSEYGISNDDPDVVKGRAGSPYAVKDYYSVNPDLADDPAKRLEEFEALIQRTHDQGMKVIIDIVPNHVARDYQSLAKPEGIKDFGEDDNTSVDYSPNNNFYYIPGEDFQVPDLASDIKPLGGEPHPLADGQFFESPAKWTGNGSRLAKPKADDWYETVKVNYGVRPDGSYDFAELPEAFRFKDHAQHAEFWADKTIPDSWLKFEHIVHYWLDKGVDGFRYDMAEMVPVEFWSYLNSSIKVRNPEAFILAEVYNPALYRDYIQLGKMDYLYDKVEFYDNLKWAMQQKQPTDALELIQSNLFDIEQHMLHFLENHDEQRIASPEFAGDASWGKPALVVSALISRSPTMLYFGQDVGEKGEQNAGFGRPSRTSIFDYIGVPAHQRWMNKGKFDGGQSSQQELALRQFYERVMNISAFHPTMTGSYQSLHSYNRWKDSDYGTKQFAFVRWTDNQQLFVITSFEPEKNKQFTLHVPPDLIKNMGLEDGEYSLHNLLNDESFVLKIAQGTGLVNLTIQAKGSLVLEMHHDD